MNQTTLILLLVGVSGIVLITTMLVIQFVQQQTAIANADKIIQDSILKQKCSTYLEGNYNTNEDYRNYYNCIGAQ